MQERETSLVDPSIWLKEIWVAGEVTIVSLKFFISGQATGLGFTLQIYLFACWESIKETKCASC